MRGVSHILFCPFFLITCLFVPKRCMYDMIKFKQILLLDRFLVFDTHTGSWKYSKHTNSRFWVLRFWLNVPWFWFSCVTAKLIYLKVLMNQLYFFPSRQKCYCEFGIFTYLVNIISMYIGSSVRGLILSCFLIFLWWRRRRLIYLYWNPIMSD